MTAIREIGPIAAAVVVVGGCGGRAGVEGARPARAPGSEEIEEQPEKVVPPTAIATGPEVVFHPPGTAAARISVELARTERQLQLGLMYRTSLPPDAGMLFLFRRPKVQAFWMKNTFIPLDIIFVSSDMTVVGVVENAAPGTTARRWLPHQVSQYVVEVNAWWARVHQVGAGTRVEFVRVPMNPGDDSGE